jgi:hypothetical protein
MRTDARAGERGAVAAFVAFGLVMLVTFVAVALNLGHLMSVRGELQNAADLGAVSGAGMLDGTPANLAQATAKAQQYGNFNVTDSHVPMGVKSGDVVLGKWSYSTKSFTPLSDPAQSTQINAVKVTTYRNDTHSGPVDVLFSAFLGKSERDVASSAIAVHGAPCRVCGDLPLTISNCEFPLPCNKTVTVTWSSDKIDDIAWTTLGFSTNVNASELKTILDAIAATDPNDPNPPCNFPVNADNTIAVSNGVVTSACKSLESLWTKYPTRKYSVPLIQVDPCPAAGTKFVGDFPVSQFVRIEFIAVDCKNHFLQWTMRCGQAVPPGATNPGCGFLSISPMPPALVQ